MQQFRMNYCHEYSLEEILGVVDIGKNAVWMDFGTVNGYFTNMLKLTSNTQEGKMMRMLLSVEHTKELHGDTCMVHDDNSILINCNIRSGTVKNSILLGVNAESIEVSNSLIINSKLYTLKADHSLLYNVLETEKISFKKGTIRADIQLPNEHLKFYTQMNRDSHIDWNMRLQENPFSYAELHQRMLSDYQYR
jgi:hypothetical protein